MGLTGDCAATVDHGDEFGEAMRELQHERFMRRAIELAANDSRISLRSRDR